MRLRRPAHRWLQYCRRLLHCLPLPTTRPHPLACPRWRSLRRSLRRAPPARMTDYSRGHPILAMSDARLQDTSASQLLEMYSEIYDRPPFCNDICQRDFGFALVRRWRSVKARWCQPAGMPVSVGLFGLYLYIYIYVYYLGLFCQEKVSFAPRVPLELCHIVAVPARRYANLNTPLWPYE